MNYINDTYIKQEQLPIRLRMAGYRVIPVLPDGKGYIVDKYKNRVSSYQAKVLRQIYLDPTPRPPIARY